MANQLPITGEVKMRIPVELLSGLAKHLATEDLIRWRLVCKEWRWFIDEFCLKELILFIHFYPTLELWKCGELSGQPIDLRKAICLTSDCCLSDAGFRYTFRNVEKLFLIIRNETCARYQIDFPRLKHLEITRHNRVYMNHFILFAVSSHHEDLGGVGMCNANFDLNLESLKTLYVNTLCDGIALNCPNLSEISFHLTQSSFKLPLHYKQIRKLTCFYNHRWIKELENLESLTCHSYCDRFDSNFLKYFPKLQFLYFYSCDPHNVIQIEEEKVRLGRNDLKIFYFGSSDLEFMDPRWPLSWADFDCFFLIAYLYNNDLTKLVPTLPTFFALHYDKSFRDYPREFYTKLTNVQALSITQGPIEQSKIIELIGWLENLVILWLNETPRLNHQFYEILPDHNPYLRLLHIDNRELADLDLSVLLRLNHLYKVEFKNPSSAENYTGYAQLTEKVAAKKKEIVETTIKLLFQIDEVKFLLENLEAYNSVRARGAARPRFLG